ncbi:hypothetical protein [Alkalinema sp. FACHB-956]|uniref:hypothetical protein n=1 Tax=Alkalinema sp. FACHB-956 TaxID=2692768 RepID=UPI001682FEFF|nr:hypothetical protein [Alkalinema sp. FACHB-956]MBD2325546.1 hypothetical protein [Alkalinema sp. FACHB-956]
MSLDSQLDRPSEISYAALQLKIQPGDVLVFSGSDIPSNVVKIATQSDHVHVAIVFSVDRTNDEGDNILIAESHIDTSLPSVGTGQHNFGAQLQWLSHRIAASQTPVRWAALHPPLSESEIRHLQAWLWEIEQQQVSYDFVQAIGAGMDAMDDLCGGNPQDLSALFCSELVTYALQTVNRIDASINPSEQTPADVMQFPCLHPPITIVNSPLSAITVLANTLITNLPEIPPTTL